MLTLFMYLAGLGLASSLIVHALTLLRAPCLGGEYVWALHVGIFVVWLPALVVARRLTKDFKQRDFWKSALRGCPQWMKVFTHATHVYAVFSVVVFLLLGFGGGGEAGACRETPLHLLRGFSGLWMGFYSAAMAFLYSAIHVGEYDATRRCPAGHPVPPSARYCEERGSPVAGPLVS